MHAFEDKLQRAFPQFTDWLPVRQLGEGFGSLVLESANGLVFRIAKNAIAAANHHKEKLLLPLLCDQLTLQIPDPQYYVAASPDFPYGVIGYCKIEGDILSPEAVTPLNLPKIAAQIAGFLYEVHQATLPA